MNKQNYILAILFFSLTIVSLGQTKNEKVGQKIEAENENNNIISNTKNRLTGKIESIEIEYTVWGCYCPQWIKTKDLEINDTSIKFIEKHFYIEPANNSLELPIYFDPFRHKVKLTGQFYERKDYPRKKIKTEERILKANIFRYTEIEVIDKPDFKIESKIDSLTLIYNALSCTCAQWTETHIKNENDKIYYWLESANDKLINADSLFNGEDLPVIIKVTGQIVSEHGFPKRNLAKVRQDKAGKVFKYTKIEVIQIGQEKNGK